MFGSRRPTISSLLVFALVCSGCTPTRVCEGDGCECSADNDCIIGCVQDADLLGCDCTNGFPVTEKGHEGEEGCGEMECAAAMCATWTEYEARCSFGRCVGVPVGDHP